MRKFFGTDGIRGVANMEPMTVEMALKLGRAAAHVFRRDTGRRHQFVIAKDTRLSGYMFESALVAGLCSMGVDAILVGPMPTPACAFITRSLRADAGIMISASHNSYEDNGIKLFSREGYKLPDEIELELERLLSGSEIDFIQRPTATQIGKAYRISDVEGRYIEFLKSSFPKGMTVEGFNIALDCANGATYQVAPAVFAELGAKVFVYCDKPNGENINRGCGSLHPKVIKQGVRKHQAQIGISFDGDGDRVIFADEHGQKVDGDQIMAMCALERLRQGTLHGDTLVATVMSNLGLDIALRQAGGKVVRTRVGDRYVIGEMLKHGYNFGGEQCGHMIFLDYNTTGDGILAALQVLELMQKTGKPLSELAACMEKIPQVKREVRVREKKNFRQMPEVEKVIQEAKAVLGNDGRVLVRYSGTENVARVMLEGQDINQIEQLAHRINQKLEEEIGCRPQAS